MQKCIYSKNGIHFSFNLLFWLNKKNMLTLKKISIVKNVNLSLLSFPIIIFFLLFLEIFPVQRNMYLLCSSMILCWIFKQIGIRLFISFLSLLLYLTISSGYFSESECNSIVLMAAQFSIYRYCVILIFLSLFLFP